MTYYVRNLPHWHPPGTDIFITWRLHGSLPEQFRPQKKLESSGKAFVNYDRALDQARTGPLWLKDPHIAECLLAALSASPAAANYSPCVPTQSWPITFMYCSRLSRHSVKSRGKLKARRRGRPTSFSNVPARHSGKTNPLTTGCAIPGELQKIRAYIERNPVVAGLVARPEDWPWSSASRSDRPLVAQASACGVWNCSPLRVIR